MVGEVVVVVKVLGIGVEVIGVVVGIVVVV